MRYIGQLAIVILFGLLNACSKPSPQHADVTIYTAKSILTSDLKNPTATAVAVRGSKIVGVGTPTELAKIFNGALADKTFADQTIIPGLIDPHVHMILGAMMYAKPFTPPWDVETPAGTVKGLTDRTAFLARITDINAGRKGTDPLVIYGYHNLVHGSLDRHDLDAITTQRPLIIWHYSGHDFYLNSKALAYAKIDASWGREYKGVPLDKDGQPTGRVYEDAVFAFLANVGHLFLSPKDVSYGFKGLQSMFASNGVTAVAELGYGLFGLPLEDNYYEALIGVDFSTKIYMVPEHRAFEQAFGEERIAKMGEMVEATKDTWPRVLPQVKLFTDAAFYSQTMRVSPPGYTGGQNKGEEGLWVTGPDDLTKTMNPYWAAGLDVRIHSNGDAAQDATLDALAAVQENGTADGQRLVLEHVGLITPKQIAKAKELNVGISVASHYVHYMGEAYVEAIGERVKYMTPLASTIKAGLPTTMHSDAPLAPPSPLTAASVHMLRSTREGGVLTPSERITAEQSLRAITIDAAWAIGLENEIGSIEVGKQADFTILDANPLTTKAEDWPSITVWGVVLDGGLKPLGNRHE
ncbi:MAG: amidohydrolase [Robiginitomaculum sp.]|nr:amidohydrolase [Robiginitomaculum sp.]